eukprot:1392065-Amphidinium_carterae.1
MSRMHTCLPTHLETLKEQTFANQETAEEENNQNQQEEEQPLAEYDGGNSDADSGTTIPPVDQWIHENALNQDEYGFSLEQDIDDDDIRLFDEAGLHLTVSV